MAWQQIKYQIVLTPQGLPALRRYGPLARSTATGSDWCASSTRAMQTARVSARSTQVYYNPYTNQFWLIDYRVFSPETEGNTKLNHVQDILTEVKSRGIGYQTVLMDSWYAGAPVQVPDGRAEDLLLPHQGQSHD